MLFKYINWTNETESEKEDYRIEIKRQRAILFEGEQGFSDLCCIATAGDEIRFNRLSDAPIDTNALLLQLLEWQERKVEIIEKESLCGDLTVIMSPKYRRPPNALIIALLNRPESKNHIDIEVIKSHRRGCFVTSSEKVVSPNTPL